MNRIIQHNNDFNGYGAGCACDCKSMYGNIIAQFGIYSLMVILGVIYICVGFTSKIYQRLPELVQQALDQHSTKFETQDKKSEIIQDITDSINLLSENISELIVWKRCVWD